MKATLTRLTLGSLVTAVAAQAATLTIAPPTVTNDFQGKVVLTIANLPPGQSVVVDKYLDLNDNGVIDAGEPLTSQFPVTDGQLPCIGGIRNLNVPGDEDGGTNGQIRAELSFPGLHPVLGNITGSFLFQVTDPSAGFPSITGSFRVVQKVQNQGVMGRVMDGVTGLHVANALVGVDSMCGWGTVLVADTNGEFMIYTAPGDYDIHPVKPGCLTAGSSGDVSVNSGQFTVMNLTVTNGTVVVSGRLFDRATGTGLGGIFISMLSQDEAVWTAGFTDHEGTFTCRVLPGNWWLESPTDCLALTAHVGWDDYLTYITTDTHLDIPVTPADALIYGITIDSNSNTIPDIRIDAYGPHGQEVESRSLTPGANYSIAVVAGDWVVGSSEDWLQPLGYLPTDRNVEVRAGEAARADVVLRNIGAHLTGRVVDESGTNLPNIEVNCSIWGAWIDTKTDANGEFDLGLCGGYWSLSIYSEDGQGGHVMGPHIYCFVEDGVDMTNIVLVAKRPTASITGSVVDTAGKPLAGLYVGASFYDGTNIYTAGTDTASDGTFVLHVLDGTWAVNVGCESRGHECISGQAVTVSGTNVVLDFVATPRVKLVNPERGPNGQFQFLVEAPPQWRLTLQAAINLTAGSWSTLLATNLPVDFFFFRDEAAPGHPSRVYRAFVDP